MRCVEIREVRKDDWTMYEASDVVAIGEARELILGVKPFLQSYIDQQGEINRAEEVSDIDETE
jgi:hypothetical protein